MVLPYKNKRTNKKVQIAEMFDNVSHKYDVLNAVFSFGIDTFWRRKTIKLISDTTCNTHLDIACGTGDFAIEALKLNPQKIYGIDISEGMIAEGRKKIAQKGYSDKIDLQYGDSEHIHFENDSFDTITVGFGVRNFENLEQGISEMFRVLRPKGKLAVLEFSKPKVFPIKQLYHFYSFTVLPLIGRIVSKDPSAYTYLPESIREFPDGEDFLSIMRKQGFTNTFQKRLMFGIVSIYIGSK